MQINEHITSLEIADKTIVHFNDFEMTGKWTALSAAGFTEDIIQENNFLKRPIHQAIKLLSDNLQYIEQTGNSGDWFFLTDLGRQVKNAGGHFAYLKKLQEKSIADKDRQERKDESEKLDLQIKRWQIKTKYFPYIVSTLALVVSIFSYFKPEKKQQDLQTMQEQIQQLKDRVKLLDSLLQLDTPLKKSN